MPDNYFSKLTNSTFWKKTVPFWLSLIIILGLAVIVLLIVNSASKISLPEQIEFKKEPKAQPLKVPPVASGRQSYDIITDSSKIFKIIEADIDPLDVKSGEIQTVTVQVKDTENNPITKENKVEAIVFTDNTATPFPFSLKKVEDSDGATITTWQGSWVCEDTYNSKYMITIKAKSLTKEHSIDLSFR